MDKKLMQQEFKEILVDDNGLHYISTPTGSGKTYEIVNAMLYIAENDLNSNRKFIFLAPQKKNLPVGIMKKCKESIYIPSHEDSLKVAMRNKFNFYELPFIQNNEKAKEDIKYLEHMLSDDERYKDSQLFKDKINAFYTRLHSYVKKEFRRICDLCEETKEKDSDKINQAKLTQAYKSYLENKTTSRWLYKLAPEYYTFTKKIVIMTYDKFLYPMRYGIGDVIDFINPQSVLKSFDKVGIKDLTIICDEMHAFKEIIWKNIIENSCHNAVDLLKIIIKINNKEVEQTFNTTLQTVWNRKAYKKNRENIYKQLDNLKKYYFDRDYYIETQEYEEKYKRDFGIFESTVYPVINNIADKISIGYNGDKNQVNFYIKNETSHETFNLNNFIHDSTLCIRYFSLLMKKIAPEYNRLEKNNSLSARDALFTILDKYNFSDEEKEFLYDIQPVPRRSKSIYEKTLNPMGRGFEYIKIANDSSHDDTARLSLYSIPHNPDTYIANLAINFNIIGLTANGSIEMLENFSSDYLYEVLEDKFHLKHKYIDEYYKWYYKRMEEEYKIKNIKIEAKFAPVCKKGDVDDDSIRSWISNNIKVSPLCLSYKIIKMALDRYRLECLNDFTFDAQRYLEIISVIAEFINEPLHKTGLFFTQMSIHNTDKLLYRIDTIKPIIDNLCIEKGITHNEYCILFFEKGTNIDAFQKELAKAYMKDYKKVFIFSSHKSISTGVNLQGPYNSNENTVIIDIDGNGISNKDHRFLEKDIVFLYIGSIHHWSIESSLNQIVNLDTPPAAAYNKAILNTLRKIVELLNRSGSHFNSFYEYQKTINTIINIRREGKWFKKKFYIDNSQPLITNHLLGELNQMIGRINRAYVKNEHITIILSNRFREEIRSKDINFNIKEDALMTPELSSVYTLLESEKPFSPAYKDSIQECRSRTHQSWYFVKYRLNNIFDDGNDEEANTTRIENIKRYSLFREKLLATPTQDSLSEIEALDRELPFFWIKSLDKRTNSYRYEIPKGIFEPKVYTQFIITTDSGFEVSQEAAKLQKLMRIKLYNDEFIKNGYATEWKKGEYILNPYAFKVYKGILGEAIGEIIFRKQLGFSLSSLSIKHFELFDFCMTDTPNIMIDFKHWSDSFVGDSRDKYLSKVYEKMEEAECTDVFIIKLFNKGIDNIMSFSNNNKMIYNVPGLLDENANIIPTIKDKLTEIILKKGVRICEME